MTDARLDFYRAKVALHGLQPMPHVALVGITAQRLWVYEGEKMLAEYKISTSLKPASCQYGSCGTPVGLHEVAEKIGEGAAWGTIFQKREPVGVYDPKSPGEKGLITTRILWLRGLEEGKNAGYECGSYNRKIYIHGTNLEHKIGAPKSEGCVELTNDDVIKVFESLDVGSHVLID